MHDVEVVYTVIHGTRQVEERTRWQAATGKQRVDMPGGTYMLSDRKAGLMDMVNDVSHRVLEMHLPPGPLTGDQSSFRKLGQQTIAGITCTNWQVTMAPTGTTQAVNAVPTIVCLTPDGVTLAMKTGETQGAIARSVTYDVAAADAFVVPAGYAKVTPSSVRPPADH